MNILIIDDDVGIRETLAVALESLGHTAIKAANSAAAQAKLRQASFDAAFLDVRLGADDGLALLPELLRLSPRLAVVVITAYTSIESAVRAIREGAFDYLSKPFKPAQIAQLLERLSRDRQYERRIAELESRVAPAEVEVERSADPRVVGILTLARKSAPTTATILIQGESGTGKSLLARQIYRWSSRAQEPFVTINCPSLSRDLLESELFGHMKGAFTGAVANTWGKVAAADRGTLFLDEIGELPLEIQPKLLRLLQEREYERVGESVTRMADVRVIAATNRNLQDAVAKGTFREDLFYRLNVISLHVPPLRERPSDILATAEGYVRSFCAANGKPVAALEPSVRHALTRYSWPGNMRELRNVIERATILCEGESIRSADLPPGLMEAGEAAPQLGGGYSLEEIEAEHLRRVLRTSATAQEAAQILGIDPTTLLRKRKALGL